MGRYIQSRGGVVTAEELAPYLDPPEPAADGEIDESYVVPALVRFEGSPEVDEQGNLLYRFESRSPRIQLLLPILEFIKQIDAAMKTRRPNRTDSSALLCL